MVPNLFLYLGHNVVREICEICLIFRSSYGIYTAGLYGGEKCITTYESIYKTLLLYTMSIALAAVECNTVHKWPPV